MREELKLFGTFILIGVFLIISYLFGSFVVGAIKRMPVWLSVVLILVLPASCGYTLTWDAPQALQILSVSYLVAWGSCLLCCMVSLIGKNISR